MGEKTDKIGGRVKQAVGAITGDGRPGTRGSAKRTRANSKGRFDSAIGKAQTRLRTSRQTKRDCPFQRRVGTRLDRESRRVDARAVSTA